MSEVKPYAPTEMVGVDSNGEEFVRGGLDVARVRATFVAIEVEREKWRSMALGAQKRIEELEAALREVEFGKVKP